MHFANLEPSADDIDLINSSMEEAVAGMREVFAIPLTIENKQMFYVRAGRFGIVFIRACEKPRIVDVIVVGSTS